MRSSRQSGVSPELRAAVTVRDPIPDAALRALEGALSPGAVVDAAGHGVDMKRLLGDFLALRGAARVALNRIESCCADDLAYGLTYDADFAALRALLPEAPHA